MNMVIPYKWIVVVWLLIAGAGVSYSIVAERRKEIRHLKKMEHSLKRLAYYMYHWRMPIREAVEQTAKEEEGVLYSFYEGVKRGLEERKIQDFGTLWKEESSLLWQQKLPDCIKKIWSNGFVHIPMEPEALHRRLTQKADEIAEYTEKLQEKYKGEQRMVFTMGFFVSAFLCLMLW